MPPTETGSYSDLKQWDANTLAEPIMRVFQLSEGLARMARRIQKRYPKEAKKLKLASEDIVYAFYKGMEEEQNAFVKKTKQNDEDIAKLDEERKKKLANETQSQDDTLIDRVSVTSNEGS